MKYAVIIGEHSYGTNDAEFILSVMRQGTPASVRIGKNVPLLPKQCWNLGNGGFLPDARLELN